MTLAVVTVTLIVCAPSSGQSVSTASDQVIKGCEQAVEELKVRRVEVEGLKAQLLMRDERDRVRDQFEANQADQIAFWKDAATARKEALNIDDRVDRIRLEQIVEYRGEIDRLRAENAALRRSRDKRFLIGTILGTAVGGFIWR